MSDDPLLRSTIVAQFGERIVRVGLQSTVVFAVTVENAWEVEALALEGYEVILVPVWDRNDRMVEVVLTPGLSEITVALEIIDEVQAWTVHEVDEHWFLAE